MEKQKLIEAIQKELMRHYPEGTQFREITAKQQAEALVKKFDIRGKRKCQTKE